MIKQISEPKYQAVCDRCGKTKIFEDDPNKQYASDSGLTYVEFLGGGFGFRGDVCKECCKDFVTLAENFFDESNKVESEDKE